MAMPDFGPLAHIASVSYDCMFGEISIGGGALTFGVPSPVRIIAKFETGRTQPDPQKDLWDVTWDYSEFSQDELEAGIRSTLGTICAAIAMLLSVTEDQVQQSVTIRRVWNAGLNQQGSAAARQLSSPGGDSGAVLTETMPYP
jgi:hypothetical protein